MNTKKLIIEQLRAMATILEPFIDDISPDTKVWNGSIYAYANPREGDRFARVWWSQLKTISDLLEIHDSALKQEHLSYIHEQFLSGMGSFVDFSLNESQWGESAIVANKELNNMSKKLFKLISEEKEP